MCEKMTDKPRRNALKYGIAAIIGAAVVGGGGYAAWQATQNAAPTSTPTSTPTPTPTPTVSERSKESKGRPFKIAHITIGTKTDLSWDQQHWEMMTQSLEKLDPVAREYGFDGIDVQISEFIGIGEMDRVYRDYATEGVDMITTAWGILYEPMEINFAADYPDLPVASGCSYQPLAPNVAAFCVASHESGFLGGMLAGGMTKTNKVGCVVGMAIPCCTRAYRAYELGAKYVNPDVEYIQTVVGDYYDVEGGYEAYAAQAQQGVDIIWDQMDLGKIGTTRAAREYNVMKIEGFRDTFNKDPFYTDIVLAACPWNFPYYAMINDVLRMGKIKETFYFPGLSYEFDADPLYYPGTGIVYNEEHTIPADLIEKIEKVKAEIISGERVVPDLLWEA